MSGNETIHRTLDFVDGKVRADPIEELRGERDYYRAALDAIAEHDWQEIGAKGHRYTLAALAELIDTARSALNPRQAA